MAKKQVAATKTGRAVVVTTEHRGVFFGYLYDEPGETITLQRARNCLYWSVDVKGVWGLAASGPTKSCRVGPAVASLTLFKITGICECSPEAIEAWEKAPWQI